MHRLLLSTALITTLISAPALARDYIPNTLCAAYPGRVDVEGKFGGQRHIGETSILLPLACSDDDLLFTDIRFKGDNKSNREVNLGLGARTLYGDGILGGYAYFDRKLSGITDKYHNQITAGAEWLAETWEVRGNAYIPITGEKEIISAGSVSAPYLSGTGIFFDEQSAQRVKEEGLYGADIEGGFKIPDTKLWLYAGAFNFDGEDADTVRGGRIRAKYDVTENIALTAEGQYDGERGRMGWLGVRFSVPFGGDGVKPEGLKARMTASPVRDIDIVTSSKAEKIGEDRTVAVLNADTGAVQRVLYIDNTTAGGGDGSMNNPFNTLALAQAAMQDHDVIYINSGSGTAGMDQGITLNRQGVQLIGAGANFVYDGNKFTTATGENFTGTLLKAAGTAPTLTNTTPRDTTTVDTTNLVGNAVTITANNASVSGITADGATASGIRAWMNGTNVENITIRDITATNNGEWGVAIRVWNNGRADNVVLDNLLLEQNTSNGLYITPQNGGVIDNIYATNITANNNIGSGVNLLTFSATSRINNAFFDNLTAEYNTTVNGRGFYVRANGGYIGNVVLQNSSITHNEGRGIYIDDDTGVNNLTFDMGGGTLDSAGYNRIFGNGTLNMALYRDVALDLDGTLTPASARYNWWGQAGGPVAGQIVSETIGATPPAANSGSANASDALDTDPRP